MAKIKIVWDIDDVIASCGKVDRQTTTFFLRRGMVIQAADVTHYIFPGFAELFKKLDSYNDVTFAFFSSAPKPRNDELVEKFLIRSLGQDRYNEIKNNIIICSREDLTEKTDSDAMARYDASAFYGKRSKNLSKTLNKDESIENVIFIDDQPSYVHVGQHSNYLHSRCVESNHFEALGFPNMELPNPRVALELFTKVNHVYYLASRICKVLDNVVSGKSKTVADALFLLQYKARGEQLFNYSLKRNDNFHEKQYYEEGLKILRAINPMLGFADRELYLSVIKESENEDESKQIDLAAQKQKEGCAIM